MRNKIFINAWGGLGDVVLSTPVFKQLKQDNPSTEIVAISRSKERLDILRGNPYIDRLMLFSFWNKLWIRLGLLKVVDIQYGELNPSYSYKKKAPEIIAEMVGVTLRDTSLQLYITEKEDHMAKEFLSSYKLPILIHITSNTTENQMWPVENWNELVASMPDCTFLQMGASNEARIDNTIDLRGKTNVRESMALVKHARSFVGVVSFLSHVTGAFGTKSVILFGGVSAAAVWSHDCNINIVKFLPCSPCVDILMRIACPYGKLCMRIISVSEVREAIMKQIG